MANNGNRNVWEHREMMESRMSKMEAHVENIYHHVKRIENHLDKQNGRRLLDDLGCLKKAGLYG